MVALNGTEKFWKFDRVSAALHLGAGAFAAVIATAFALGSGYTHATDNLESLTEKLARMEKDRGAQLRDWADWRVRIEDEVSTTKADVRWMRGSLETLIQRSR